MKTLLLLAVPAALAAAAPLAAQDAPAPAGAGHAQSATRHHDDVITPDEIQRTHVSNAYELIQSRRPAWLNRLRPGLTGALNPQVTPAVAAGNRTGSSIHAPRFQAEGGTSDLIVLMDGMDMGGKEALRSIPVLQVYSIEFVPPAQSRLRFDRFTRDGAIVIYTTAEQAAAATRPQT
jgi:hypothetical protein